MNIAVYNGYRADVDEYTSVTVHGIREGGGFTLCGKPLPFRRQDRSNHPVDCKRCLKAKA